MAIFAQIIFNMDHLHMGFLRIMGFLMVFITMLTSSCIKDIEPSDDPSYFLSFSSDTIVFDTVFTTIGSTTRYLKVYNHNDKPVNISNIMLAGGTSSQYSINIDGDPSTSVSNIEIKSGDSLYVFIKVTVDPTTINTPFVITDSVLFVTNGNLQDVDLAAWGQNARYYVGDKKIPGLSYPYTIIAEEGEITNWEDTLPIVIYGWGVVDSAAQLVIGPGVNVHFHQNSGLWIYRGGSIQVNGEADSLVTFQGDRLEYDFKDLPGQWDRIWINEGSVNNEFNYAVIKNGFIGLQAEITSEHMGNALVLNNTIIQNMSRWGLFTIAYDVVATNSLFVNCAQNTLFVTTGGNYDFRHCTFANYWNSSVRLDPSFTLSNNLIIPQADGSSVTLVGDLNAYFGNCIIYGNRDEEMLYSDDESVAFNYVFDHCDLKTQMDLSDATHYITIQQNKDPKFVDYTIQNYRLDTLSPVSDFGSLEVINSSLIDITLDLDQNSRVTDIGPDLGAYEFIPGGGKKQ